MPIMLILAALLVFFLGWKGVGIAILAALIVVIIIGVMFMAFIDAVTSKPKDEEEP